mgnify:CR=1 FL=1
MRGGVCGEGPEGGQEPSRRHPYKWAVRGGGEAHEVDYTPYYAPHYSPYYNHRVCGERRTLALAPELETRGAWYLSEMMKAITYLCTCAYK